MVHERKRRRRGGKGLPTGATMASSPAGMNTADSAFSPADSGCGWCDKVKQTKAEAKARADGGDAERHSRQWHGGACGSGELRCALLRLLLGRDGTER
jgi:hypothetical protein